MSEYKEQKAIKPKAEDIGAVILEKGKSDNLTNFIAFLKDNKLTPRWASSNSWTIRYKNKGLCHIKMDSRGASWNVRLERSFFDEYDKYIADGDMREFILGMVNAPLCENRECRKRKNEILFGKRFDEVCRCWPFMITDPEGAALENLKKSVLISKNLIAELIAVNPA